MLITQTPFRVSFFGGGTDYPEYFETHGGAVLGSAIDKYAYFSIMRFPSKLFDHNLRIGYRVSENVSSVEDIRHVPFRECMKACGITRDVEITYTAEMPSFSGLGSSSSFIVGLLRTLNSYNHKYVSPIDLAHQAIHMERDILGDAVGCQDQTFAALGGFNVIEFKGASNITVSRVRMTPARLDELENSLVLVFTRILRKASGVAKKQIDNVGRNAERLGRIRHMVDKGYGILTGNEPLEEFGLLLDEMWRQKCELDCDISGREIQALYEKGLASGAVGGKLLGAGGGGFILFFVPPEERPGFNRKMGEHELVDFRLNAPGSMIVHDG